MLMLSLTLPRQLSADRLTTADTSPSPDVDATGLCPAPSVRRSTLPVNERGTRRSRLCGGTLRPLDAQSERHMRRLHGFDYAHDRRCLVLGDRGIAIHH